MYHSKFLLSASRSRTVCIIIEICLVIVVFVLVENVLLGRLDVQRVLVPAARGGLVPVEVDLLVLLDQGRLQRADHLLVVVTAAVDRRLGQHTVTYHVLRS